MPPAPPSFSVRHLQIGSQQLDYRLLRSARRSIGFCIDETGLRITAPKKMPLTQIEQIVREKQGWIFTKLKEREQVDSHRLQRQTRWITSPTLPYMGMEIILRLQINPETVIHYDATTTVLTVAMPELAQKSELKETLKSWLKKQAQHLFSERLAFYAKHLDVAYKSFELSSARTRWGSCTAQGKIRLNWSLIHFELFLIDYVIVHELSHLREINHSPRFWQVVGSVFPDFQHARKKLQKQSREILPVYFFEML